MDYQIYDPETDPDPFACSAMEAFDRLPPRLRQFVRDDPTCIFDPMDVEEVYEMCGDVMTTIDIMRARRLPDPWK